MSRSDEPSANRSSSSHHPPSTNDHQNLVLTTPKSHKTHQSSYSSTIAKSNPKKTLLGELTDQAPSKTPTHHASINSPRKIKKIVQQISSPSKRHHGDRFLASQNQSSVDALRKTPKRFTPSSNPFDLDSGGGRGSPNLFANLLLESKKETPRTKARKFLMGIGSPLRPRLDEAQDVPESQTGVGLSSFLKSQSVTLPENSPTEGSSNLLDGDHNEDDEILGPSPFKPKAQNDIFQPLFDDPEPDFSPHHSQQSPTRAIKSKWKIGPINTPFIPQSSQNTDPPPPDCGQKESLLQDRGKKKNGVLATKRKRLVLPGQEDPSFFENLPDPSSSHQSSLLLMNRKKKRVEGLSQTLHEPVKGGSNQAKKTNRKSNLFKKRQVVSLKTTINPSSRPSTDLFSDGSHEDSDRSKQEIPVPPLPSGKPDQSAVYTELETFKFSTTTNSQGKSKKVNSADDLKKKDKGKAKAANGADDEDQLLDSITKPVKLGTRKVLVRAYRPMKESERANRFIRDSVGGWVDSGTSDFEFDESKATETTEEEDAGDEDEEANGDYTDEAKSNASFGKEEELEADVQVSEDLIGVLNIDDCVTSQGDDRRQLLRELKRERTVRRILNGMTIMEKTFTGNSTTATPPTMTATDRKDGGNSKAIKRTSNRRPIVKPIKSLDSTRSSFKKTVEPIGGENKNGDDLRFELALGELELDQQIDDEVIDHDDDWEDEPLGWKDDDVDHDDGFVDDRFVL